MPLLEQRGHEQRQAICCLKQHVHFEGLGQVVWKGLHDKKERRRKKNDLKVQEAIICQVPCVDILLEEACQEVPLD